MPRLLPVYQPILQSLFTLLNPSALLALLGLSVPVAIHLWNRRPGREVAVGSLRWLVAGANRRLRNLKPEQLWLLLLRAALLAVLAVAVAGPVWRQTQPAGRGVVLLSAEAARLPALAGLQPTIDSLQRKGYELRWLAAGFPRVPGAAWRALATGQPSGAADSLAAGQPLEFAWARVQQAAGTFPGQPLFVVTSSKSRNFQGSHPPLPAAVSWQTLPDSTTTSWLAAAELVGDSLQLLVGRSREIQTTYRRERILEQHNGQPIRVDGLEPVRFLTDKKGGDYFVLTPVAPPVLRYEVGVDIPPPVIEIYASPEFAADARYLEAALRAAAVGMPIPPLLRRVRARPDHLVSFTFWLSDEPLPQSWQEDVKNSGYNLWREAAGPGVADTSRLATADASEASVTVFRRGPGQPAPGGETLWADGQGRPILSRQALGRGGVYQLHTRLHPAWSQLADAPELPARLLLLLQPEATDDESATLFLPHDPVLAQRLSRFDQRALDPSQLANAARLQDSTTPKASINQRITDLRSWLVLLAGLLFLTERLLAWRGTTRAFSIAAP